MRKGSVAVVAYDAEGGERGEMRHSREGNDAGCEHRFYGGEWLWYHTYMNGLAWNGGAFQLELLLLLLLARYRNVMTNDLLLWHDNGHSWKKRLDRWSQTNELSPLHAISRHFASSSVVTVTHQSDFSYKYAKKCLKISVSYLHLVNRVNALLKNQSNISDFKDEQQQPLTPGEFITHHHSCPCSSSVNFSKK